MKKILLNLERNYLLLFTLLVTCVSFGQNLYDSNGAVIWNATTNSGYNNVKYIGRDDAISLNLKQHTASTPKIGLGTIASNNAANPNSFSTDRAYLVWGDNGGSMNDSGTDVTITFGGTSGVTTLVDIPNKKWKVVETGGDVSMTKVSLATSDFSSLPALAGDDAYVMIVANDAAFSSGVETVFLSASGANQVGNFDFDGTKFFTFGVAHQNTLSRQVSFDGTDDVIKFDAVNNLTVNFTMMFWIKPNGQNTSGNNRTIVSKYNGTSGYRVYLSTDNKLNITWTGGTMLTSTTVLPNNEWHNIAIVFSLGTLQLYIDGVMDSSLTSAPTTSDSSIFSIGGEYRNKSDIRNYFKGEIDEFRLWRRGMNLSQIKYMMNQEIALYGTDETTGTILPYTITKNDITGTKWYNLIAYYSMNKFIGSHVEDDSSFSNRGYLFTNNPIIVATQAAPIPYESATNGTWSSSSTWVDGSIPNSNSIVNPTIPITWNIVRTNHNVSSNGSQKLMALLVNSNTLSATNDTKLEISHYLKLDGKIDLVGRSQLLQTDKSDLDVTSSGYIERDQQGQANIYNYNYWSSPVSSINTTANNNGFTVADVMKDGTTSTPQNISWSGGTDGSPTSPITLASYWIFKFQDLANGYANWATVGQNGNLLAGQGYTMKGSGTAAVNQNYTFVGKPNNGTITSSVSASNLNLCGNPYPSALDANRFIDDNISSITGTLYFWEHYSTNTSHNTIQYQGGYATYTKTGGTAPVAPSGVSGSGMSRKKPERYIPVGQGFFVVGSATGGTVTFNNSQRAFFTETSTRSYTLFRSSNTIVEANIDDEIIEDEQFIKLHLGYDSANNIHRQTLIGFMNQHATSAFDNGYDGLSLENLNNDMYFLNNGTRLNIQGEGYFNVNAIYPIGVKNAVAGMVKFGIDEKENLDESQDIFLFDNVTNEYHNIKSESVEINLPAGTHDSRFSLRFLNPTALGLDQNSWQNGLFIAHSNNSNTINIENSIQDISIKSVALYNLIGQNITNWKVENQNEANLNLPLSDLSSGTYIVKVTTDKGSLSKKIVIK